MIKHILSPNSYYCNVSVTASLIFDFDYLQGYFFVYYSKLKQKKLIILFI